MKNDGSEQELVKLEKDYWEAIKRHDIDASRRHSTR